MIRYMVGGSAGTMFESECNECKNVYLWKELVVTEYDISHDSRVHYNVKERHCVPCHEDKYTKLNITEEK